MKTYARIEDGLVSELFKTDRDVTSMFNPSLVWVDASSHPDIAEGWHYDGTKFTPPPPPPPSTPLPTMAQLQAQLAAIAAELVKLSGNS